MITHGATKPIPLAVARIHDPHGFSGLLCGRSHKARSGLTLQRVDVVHPLSQLLKRRCLGLRHKHTIALLCPTCNPGGKKIYPVRDIWSRAACS